MARASSALFTVALIVLTVAAFVAGAVFTSGGFMSEQMGFIPMRVSMASSGFVIPVWLTPLTATLSHGGMVHLALNMMMLFWCGRGVEALIGRVALTMLYISAAYGAAAAHYLLDPLSMVPMIGASGAISGLIAVYALLFGRNKVKRVGPIPAHWVRAIWLAIAWVIVQWMMGFASHGSGTEIAWAAHVGGFLVGLVLARPLLAWRYRQA